MSYTELFCPFAHLVKEVVLIKTSGYLGVWCFTLRVKHQTPLVSCSNRFGNCPLPMADGHNIGTNLLLQLCSVGGFGFEHITDT